MKEKNNDIRNIAIIAHVDHGKTTLVDVLLRQSGAFESHQIIKDRVMDSGDIERERGITILSKNTAISYKGTKINIIDTPGHADFGGEVERILKMVDGVILVVDAFEGPMPQTKFVLRNAIDLDLPIIVCINKIDRDGSRPIEVVDEVLELFMELGANESQFESPFLYASAKEGKAYKNLSDESIDISPIFDTIIDYIPAPTGNINDEMQTLISTIDFNEYIGRIGIGKVETGKIKINDEVLIHNIHEKDKKKKAHITKLYVFDGLDRIEVTEAPFGSIVAIAGIEGINIGDTISSPSITTPLNFIKISEPTISINFIVNNSPFAGQDGKYITSSHLKDRLFKELNTDVSLKVEETDNADTFKVSGRGELHLSILIEKIRREDFEFQISKPQVLYKEIDGKKYEPMEIATIDVPEEFSGKIIEDLSKRKGELISIENSKTNNSRLIFLVPARGLIGYRQDFLTNTKGTGIMNSNFDGYDLYKGDIITRVEGSLIAFETGEAVAYGLHNAQSRGDLFITPGEKVYAGMVVGRSSRELDLEINVAKKKNLTNMRASGSEDALKLTPALNLSLEQSLDFISDDELLEITPKKIRMRKMLLDPNARNRSRKK